MVEAVGADRLAHARVVLVVHAPAGKPHAVRANGRVVAGPAAPRPAVRPVPACVHRAEARRGQRDEHGRVLGDRVGDALAAPEAGDHKLVRVAAVALRARRADGLAPVPAGLAQNPVRLRVRRPHAPAPAALADLDPAGQADRARTVPGGAQLRLKGREVRPCSPSYQRVQELGCDSHHAGASLVRRPARPARLTHPREC